MAWKIKQKPSDFVVHEIIHDVTEESWKEKMSKIHGAGTPRKAEGTDKKYLWMTMRKDDADFFSAIYALGKALSISTKDIGYAGTKDKRAVTFQTVSVPAEKEAEARALGNTIPKLTFTDFRLRARPIRIGEHEGNEFEIMVRNIEKPERPHAEARLRKAKDKGFINFFGEQRFGSVSGRNAEVGKMLVLSDVKGAVLLLTEGMPAAGTSEHAMQRYLEKRPEDYTGALRLAPLRMLKLLVHAYQSLMWNVTAEKYASEHSENTLIPVVGHSTDMRTHPKVKKIVEEVMEKEKIGPGDFRNKVYRELSSRGSERAFICHPQKLTWDFSDDEDNPGQLKLSLTFFLKKGSYATELIRQLEGASIKRS
jgi:tRNA pseudouridine13 synthase